MKRINIIVLIALLTFIAGCSAFDEPLPPHNTDGIAQVRVNIGTNARTILPNFDKVFSKYELSMVPFEGSEEDALPLMVKNGDSNWITIGLPYGEWIITVTAYVKVSGTDYPAAKGSNYVNVWGDTRVDITLNMPESGGMGTFAYTVTYPAVVSATVKLERWPLESGGTAVINNATVSSSGATASQSVESGIYFLTVKATLGGNTVTRNEIVHIYRGLSTNANYVFTKVDFGDEKLQIGGMVRVLINEQQPGSARVIIFNSDRYSYEDQITEIDISFSGSGNGTWSAELDNLRGANTLYFMVSINWMLETRLLKTIPVSLNDETDIDLGLVSFDFDAVPIGPTNRIEGTIPLYSDFVENWYSMSVTAGTSYSFWCDNVSFIGAMYSDGEYLSSANPKYYDTPLLFTADRDGTVYLFVQCWDSDREITDYYYFGYNTD